LILAGLLAYVSPAHLPIRLGGQWLEELPAVSRTATLVAPTVRTTFTATGIAPDLHRLPF